MKIYHNAHIIIIRRLYTYVMTSQRDFTFIRKNKQKGTYNFVRFYLQFRVTRYTKQN